MKVQPSAYDKHTVNGMAAVVFTNLLTGETSTVNGPYLRIFKGKKGLTISGYRESFKHMDPDYIKVQGFISGKGVFIRAESYYYGNPDSEAILRGQY
jgi:hypothetical protein